MAKKKVVGKEPGQPDQSLQVSSSHGGSAGQLGQYLGSAEAGVSLPAISLEDAALPGGLDTDTVSIFAEMYRQHLNKLLEAVSNLNFASIQHIWLDFWSLSESKLDQAEEAKLPMSKAKLKLLLTIPEVQSFIQVNFRTRQSQLSVNYLYFHQEGDFGFYQTLVQILIPEVLRPIPPSLTQAIRNFAKSLESWLTAAMVDCPEEIRTIKLSTVRSFAQTLR